MRRLVIAICLVALSFFLFGRQVEAGTGTTTDPAGDVFDQEAQTYGPGTLDLVSVGHSDDGSRATYVIVLKDGFDDADLHAVQIGIDGLSVSRNTTVSRSARPPSVRATRSWAR